MKAEAELRLGKPIWRTKWDAPGFEGEGWFWKCEKERLKPKLASVKRFFAFHEVQLVDEVFWSGE